jgi:hypothetical protein
MPKGDGRSVPPSQGAARYFRARYEIEPGKTLRISEEEGPPPIGTKRASKASKAIGETLSAYRKAVKRLLSEKYVDLAGMAPPHLRMPCDCLALICDDGIIVRWDRHEGDSPKVRVGATEGASEVTTLAPSFSERQVYCPQRLEEFTFPDDSPKFMMGVVDSDTGATRHSMEANYGLVVDWGSVLKQVIPSVRRPVPLISVGNEFEVQIGGVMVDVASERPDPGQEFVLRSQMRLPVGWEAFQLYPKFDPADWNPAIAETWAELDLLAAAAGHALREQQWQQLDSRAAARREYSELLLQFEGLLSGPEAPLQTFLEAHPSLLSPTHTRMWRKLRLGKHVTDFVFREAGNDYLLVELEAPTRTLFRRDGQVHEELTHAIDQVSDWVRYIEDNQATVQGELELGGISTAPRALVVIGRSAHLNASNLRKLRTIQNANPKLRIFTYDDLFSSATATIGNLLGPIWRTEGSADVYYVTRPVAES